MSYQLNYKFEELSMYNIMFSVFTHYENPDNFALGECMQPMKVKAIFYYIGETEEYIKFTTGIAENDDDYNRVSIPKSCILREPIQLYKHSDVLRYVESKGLSAEHISGVKAAS